MFGRYVDITELFGDQLQQKYISRRASFEDDLAQVLGKSADFVRPLDPCKSLLVFLTEYFKNAILKLSTASEAEEDFQTLLHLEAGEKMNQKFV